MVACTWWTGATLIGGIAADADSRTKIDRLNLDLRNYRQVLCQAKADLENQDISRLKKKAERINHLIQK